MEFKTFEYAEKNADGVLIISEESEEQAQKRLEKTVRYPCDWRLEHIRED